MVKKILLFVLLPIAIIAFIFGCEVGSPNTVQRNVNFNVAGIYRNPDGGSIPARMSGDPITQFDVIQTGSSLEAIDNHGILFKGQISDPQNSAAPYTLHGQTVSGIKVTINGNIYKSGTTATMAGTWIEPTFYSTVYATALVSADQSNSVSTATNGCQNVANYQGCCSSHGGIAVDGNGCVRFDGTGHVLCTDGAPSPTCTRK